MAKKTKAKKTNNNKKTYVAIIVDRSGSMGSIRRQAWEGLNQQIRTIKENAEKGGDTKVTIVQFDNEYEVLRNNVIADEIHEVDESEYQPRGSTALLDAIGKTVTLLEAQEQTEDTGFLVITISDGEENASTLWDSRKLKSKIKELEATDKWTFSYMLANIDMREMSANLGIFHGNSYGFVSTNVGTAQGYSTLTNSMDSYMTSRSAGVRSVKTFVQTDVKNSDNLNGTLNGNLNGQVSSLGLNGSTLTIPAQLKTDKE